MRKRPAARLLLFDREYRILLFHFVFDDGPLTGESFRDAAERELLEETGITAPIGDMLLARTAVFPTPTGELVEADERYFLVHAHETCIDESGQSDLENKYMKSFRWWTREALATSSDKIFPHGLVDLINRLTIAEPK